MTEVAVFRPRLRALKCHACGVVARDQRIQLGKIRMCCGCARVAGDAANVAEAMEQAEVRQIPLRIYRDKVEELWHPPTCICKECHGGERRAKA
jgi:hypothetical protein